MEGQIGREGRREGGKEGDGDGDGWGEGVEREGKKELLLNYH